MKKSTTMPTAVKAEAQDKKPSKFLSSLRELSEKRNVIKMLAFVLLSLSAYYFSPDASVSTAMLYIIADNARKSGRADGNVYQRNNRIRRWVYPAKVINVFTSTVRGFLSFISAAWNGLNDEERGSWYPVPPIIGSNRFGMPVEIKGKTLFTQRNMNLANIGEAVTNFFNINTVFTAPIISNVTATQTAGVLDGLDVVFDPAIETNAKVIVEATPPLSAGTSRPSENMFRNIKTPGTALDNTDTSPVDILALYIARFTSSVSAGQKIFVRFKTIDKLSGKLVATSVASGTIV